MNRKRSRKAKPLRAARGNAQLRNVNPPMINSNVRTSHKFRFIASGTVTNQLVTSNALLGIAGTIGTVTNSTVALCYESVRLKFVEVWAPPAAQGGSATVSVEWIGSANSPSIEVSDTTISVSHNAHIKCAPPKSSLASFWQISDNNATMFTLNCPTGSVVDVSIELMFVDRSAVVATQAGLTTVAIGKVYFLALDTATLTHVLVPVSLNTTF